MSYPVILASPPSGPPSVVELMEGIVHEWVDADGVVWDLNDWTSGVMLDNRGLEGMHNPQLTMYRSESRGTPGHRKRGWRAKTREVFWPIFIYGDTSAQWFERQRAFLSTIHPDKEGRWRVTANNATRELVVSGVFDAVHTYDVDPMLDGWSAYGVELEAAQPYWQGARIRRGPWQAPGAVPFLPPTGGPPLHISSSSAFGSATVPNYGDVEAWGTWTARGPLSAISLGVAGAIINVPFDLNAGQTLVIDTDPRHPSALRNGVDVTAQLGLQEYAAVPPGASVPLHVEAAGSGSITFDLVPLHFRAI